MLHRWGKHAIAHWQTNPQSPTGEDWLHGQQDVNSRRRLATSHTRTTWRISPTTWRWTWKQSQRTTSGVRLCHHRDLCNHQQLWRPRHLCQHPWLPHLDGTKPARNSPTSSRGPTRWWDLSGTGTSSPTTRRRSWLGPTWADWQVGKNNAHGVQQLQQEAPEHLGAGPSRPRQAAKDLLGSVLRKWQLVHRDGIWRLASSAIWLHNWVGFRPQWTSPSFSPTTRRSMPWFRVVCTPMQGVVTHAKPQHLHGGEERCTGSRTNLPREGSPQTLSQELPEAEERRPTWSHRTTPLCCQLEDQNMVWSSWIWMLAGSMPIWCEAAQLSRRGHVCQEADQTPMHWLRDGTGIGMDLSRRPWTPSFRRQLTWHWKSNGGSCNLPIHLLPLLGKGHQACVWVWLNQPGTSPDSQRRSGDRGRSTTYGSNHGRGSLPFRRSTGRAGNGSPFEPWSPPPHSGTWQTVCKADYYSTTPKSWPPNDQGVDQTPQDQECLGDPHHCSSGAPMWILWTTSTTKQRSCFQCAQGPQL